MKKRFESLDVLRGITIAAMILVNTPGSWSHVYPFLLHADWVGCTPTDLVFPFFLFIVGSSMAFSFKKYGFRLSRELAIKILRRTFLIFLIGLLLNLYPFYNKSPESWRIMGVLQRIALSYGVGAFLVVLFNRRWLIYISALVLLLYWLLLSTAGVGAYALETNLVRSIDLAVFGSTHVYGGFGIPFEPEGLLSTIPAIVTVLIGYLASAHIRDHVEDKRLILHLISSAVILICLGLLWGMTFPIIKPLWTSSYVLYTAGFAILCWALLIWIIDFKGLKRGFFFFKVYGMNALFVFVLSVIWVKTLFLFEIEFGTEVINAYRWIYLAIMKPAFGDLNGSLAFAITHILVYWTIIWYMYRRKIFVKI